MELIAELSTAFCDAELDCVPLSSELLSSVPLLSESPPAESLLLESLLCVGLLASNTSTCETLRIAAQVKPCEDHGQLQDRYH